MKYIAYPFEHGTPNMFVGFDADGNRTAIEHMWKAEAVYK